MKPNSLNKKVSMDISNDNAKVAISVCKSVCVSHPYTKLSTCMFECTMFAALQECLNHKYDLEYDEKTKESRCLTKFWNGFSRKR